jgi:hypothetical protein
MLLTKGDIKMSKRFWITAGILVVAILLVIYVRPAHAGQPQHPEHPLAGGNEQQQAQNQLQAQQQAQVQKQAQDQAQDQAQQQQTTVANTSTNANNASQSVNFDYERSAATAIGPGMSPSAQCMGVATGGVQVPGVGISLGKSYESKPCNDRELARMFAQLGKTESAMDILCKMDGADAVTDCKNRSVVKREEQHAVPVETSFITTVAR